MPYRRITIVVDMVLQETEKAFHVVHHGEQSVWLPKSQIRFTGRVGDINAKVMLPFWLAESNGMEDLPSSVEDVSFNVDMYGPEGHIPF